MDIAILGAGVGGLSAAIALLQKNFDVEIYERHTEIGNIGAGIVCWPNASFVLKELGLLEDVTRLSGQPCKMQRLSSSGENLGALDITELDHYMSYSSLSIFRSDLMKALQNRLESLGKHIIFDHQVVDIEPAAGGRTTVVFSNGRRTQPDLVIGADGRMNSIARKYTHGDNRPVYQGFINWVGVFESDRPLFTDMAIGDYWGVGNRFGIVPISPTRAYWAGASACASPDTGRRDPSVYKQELLELFSDWVEPIPTIIKTSASEDINKIYVHDHDPIEAWYRDNLLLIGDAAHACLPTSGQGACQAMEDGWHLAELMDTHQGDIERVFNEFVAIRRNKTSDIIQGGRNFAASLFSTDPAQCKIRDNASKSTDYHSLAIGISKAWSRGLPIA